MENGIGSISEAFEYAVEKKKNASVKRKRVALIIGYVFWCVGWLILAVRTVLIVPLLSFLPLSLWVLVHLTWRLTQISYEFSFMNGELTLSKIYGEKKRKEICVIPIRQFERVSPSTEANRSRLGQVDLTVTAVAEDESEKLCFIYGRDNTDRKVLIYFEMNEKVKKIVSFYNRSCLDKEIS